MLFNLLSSAFTGVNLSDCGAGSLSELNTKIEARIRETNKRDRALRILLTFRNFSSHNISAGTKDDFIFKEFGQVLTEIFRAIIHISNLP